MKRKTDSQRNIFCPTIIVFFYQCDHSYIYIHIYICIYYSEKILFHFCLRLFGSYYIWDKKFRKRSSPHSNRIKKERKKDVLQSIDCHLQTILTPLLTGYYHLLTIQPLMVAHITTHWPDQHHLPHVIPATDHANTTGHMLTIPPQMVTGITTYWPYHPQWTQVLPPNDHTTQTNLCSAHTYM